VVVAAAAAGARAVQPRSVKVKLAILWLQLPGLLGVD
jgi:hypothetical protein